MQRNRQSSINHRRASSDATNQTNPHVTSQQIWNLDQQQDQLLATVKYIIAQKDQSFSKTDKIRVQQWSHKLIAKPNNIVWRKNIVFYIKVLIQMINQGSITHPFCAVPCEGPLPNLKIADLCYPIRRKMDQCERMSRKSSKGDNGSIERVQNKCKSINMRKEYALDLDFLDERNTKTTKHMRKYSSNQVSQQREKWSTKDIKLKFTEQHNKENNSISINSSNITRRLFQNQDKACQNTIKCLYTQDRQTNNTIRSFQDFDKRTNAAMVGMQLLSKVFKLIRKAQALQGNQQGQTLCKEIVKIGNKMGVSMNQDQSILSESSVMFHKASENIRMKFSQTDEETLQFMQFLNKMKAKNQ